VPVTSRRQRPQLELAPAVLGDQTRAAETARLERFRRRTTGRPRGYPNNSDPALRERRFEPADTRANANVRHSTGRARSLDRPVPFTIVCCARDRAIARSASVASSLSAQTNRPARWPRVTARRAKQRPGPPPLRYGGSKQRDVARAHHSLVETGRRVGRRWPLAQGRDDEIEQARRR